MRRISAGEPLHTSGCILYYPSPVRRFALLWYTAVHEPPTRRSIYLAPLSCSECTGERSHASAQRCSWLRRNVVADKKNCPGLIWITCRNSLRQLPLCPRLLHCCENPAAWRMSQNCPWKSFRSWSSLLYLIWKKKIKRSNFNYSAKTLIFQFFTYSHMHIENFINLMW